MLRKALPNCIQDALQKPPILGWGRGGAPILSPGPHNDRERAPTADAGHYYTDSRGTDWGRSLADQYDDHRPYAADAHPRMDLTQLTPKQPAKCVRADNDEAAGPSNKRRHIAESHGQGAEAVQQQTEDLSEDNA
ncbi:hypothetical protein C8F04DRAFT_1199117 [Mycena alexandri]|uniref:Uncharacterized protein n=1 Tax=Mycena alexandri TaxID=1745969 RepID=A0AAD6WNU1_9AGAR|nr:hypothetical protein C8F04DRAFT_1199117 [Mycena alexandri]